MMISGEALAARAEDWNALCARSPGARPTSRAELVAHWAAHFSSLAALKAVVVESAPPIPDTPSGQGEMLAAMPLIERSLAPGIRLGSNPFNHWAAAGELLMDPRAGEGVRRRLVEGLRETGLPFLLLRGVPLDSAPYPEFEATCRSMGMKTYSHVTHKVGKVDLGGDYEAYMAQRSKNHRHQMRKSARRAEREGGVSLKVVEQGSSAEIAAQVRAGFEVEQKSWKGRAGSAVLDIEGLCTFFETHANLLADAGALHLSFLEHRDRPIAFEYAYSNGETYFTPKIGYDEGYSKFSPGQLLYATLYASYCEGPSPPQIDYSGPLSRATARWTTSTYDVGTLAVALDGFRGPLMLRAYRAYQAYKARRKKAAASEG